MAGDDDEVWLTLTDVPSGIWLGRMEDRAIRVDRGFTRTRYTSEVRPE